MLIDKYNYLEDNSNSCYFAFECIVDKYVAF